MKVKRVNRNDWNETIPDFFEYSLSHDCTIETKFYKLFQKVGELIEILHDKNLLNVDEVKGLLDISPFSGIEIIDYDDDYEPRMG